MRSWTPFAGIGPLTPADWFVERVSMAEATKALDRWKVLQREGWDVTALGAVDGTHLIGLGCLYWGQIALRVENRGHHCPPNGLREVAEGKWPGVA